MSERFYNFMGDPFNADAIPAAGHVRIQSAYYAGDYKNLTAPAAANYPAVGATRYFIYLPVIPDISDTVTRPILLRNVTGAANMTRVTTAPNANEYRVAPATSRMPQIIELNAAQAGQVIGFDFYGNGSVINSENYVQLEGNGVTVGKQFWFDRLKGAIRAGDDTAGTLWADANIGINSAAFGSNSRASSTGSFAAAGGVATTNQGAVAFSGGTSSGISAFSEGSQTQATGNYSHAEGSNGSAASGASSHAEGYGTIASGIAAHAEGKEGTASGNHSHAEGERCTAAGIAAHASGYRSSAPRDYQYSQASGHKAATGDAQHGRLVQRGTIGASTAATFDLNISEGTYGARSYAVEALIIQRNATGGSRAGKWVGYACTLAGVGTILDVVSVAHNGSAAPTWSTPPAFTIFAPVGGVHYIRCAITNSEAQAGQVVILWSWVEVVS